MEETLISSKYNEQFLFIKIISIHMYSSSGVERFAWATTELAHYE